jgi:hypothetical protein
MVGGLTLKNGSGYTAGLLLHAKILFCDDCEMNWGRSLPGHASAGMVLQALPPQ